MLSEQKGKNERIIYIWKRSQNSLVISKEVIDFLIVLDTLRRRHN